METLSLSVLAQLLSKHASLLSFYLPANKKLKHVEFGAVRVHV